MQNRLLTLLLPLLLLSLLPLPAIAQSAGVMLHRGEEVRVYAPGIRRDRIRGTVVLYQGASLDLRELGSGAVVSVPIGEIREMARNQGRDRGRSAWRSARIGAFVGGGAGLVTGPLIATTHASERFGEIMLVSGTVGLLGGAGLGAILGTVLAQDHWQRLRIPVAPVVSAAGAVGLAMTATLP